MNFYNDIDPKCCAWTQELINAGLIPPGDVVCKSILDIKPHELEPYTQVHLFCGIAGWPYALRLAGWPDDRPIITASAPCQPLSCAGKRKGHADERHLWPALYALISECRFPVCIGEQTSGPDGREWLSGVRADLEGTGYAVGCADLCAASVSAPHIRQRLYWCAVRLADCASRGLGIDGSAPGQPGHADQRGEVEWLADAEPQHDGSREPRPGRRRESPDDGAGGGLGHASSNGGATRISRPFSRNEGNPGEPDDAGDQQPFWSNSRWHACRDGKARRVPASRGLQSVASRFPDLVAALRDAGCAEAEIRQACDLFPLAQEKITGRVMLLRGAGNAIVAPVAAEFVKAVMQAMDETA